MDPVTHRNVERAMRDERYVFARYVLYGRRARAHGHPELADLFDTLADVEAFDGFLDTADTDDLGVGWDADDLREAIAADRRDAREAYRVYELQALEVGEERAAAEFARIRNEKERRAAELAKALAAFEPSAPHVHRILVVADEACDGSGLRDEVAYRAGRVPSEVAIVAPAPTCAEAEERLVTLRDGLACVGVRAAGHVGDPDPLTAIAEALGEFPADEIILATDSPERPARLEDDLVHAARERFAPRLVTHVVVDPALVHGALVPGD